MLQIYLPVVRITGSVLPWWIAMLLGILQSPRCGTAETEVYVFGQEQAIVDAITKANRRQSPQEFSNDMDYALAILLDRGFPQPTADTLVCNTIETIAGEIEQLTHAPIPESKRNSWIETVKEKRTFGAVLDEIEAAAAGIATRERLVTAGLSGMLKATGSKAAIVLRAEEAAEVTKMLEGRGTASEEQGILGLDLTGWPTVKVLPDTPAAAVGLQNGDVVARIDAKDVAAGETPADAKRALQGPVGTLVILTVKRNDKSLTFEVRKASSAIIAIKANIVEPGIVCIQIPGFEGSGIARKVNDLIHTHVTETSCGIVLDLRNNPGGRAEEANGAADIFLDDKILEIFQFRDGKQVAFKSKPGAIDNQLVVLTNGNTGSSAEMLAIALHDNHRATIVGQTTAGFVYGKDGEKLRDGRIFLFRSEPTVLSPTGADYSEKGLRPDIEVVQSTVPGKDKELERAVQLLRDRTNSSTAR